MVIFICRPIYTHHYEPPPPLDASKRNSGRTFEDAPRQLEELDKFYGAKKAQKSQIHFPILCVLCLFAASVFPELF
jgi:hypothetical protein